MAKVKPVQGCLMLVGVVIFILAMARGLLVSESVATETLETNGFSNVKVVSRNVFFLAFRGGHRSDAVRFTCRATNPAGREVTVYVFAGWPFASATVRTP